MLFTTVPLIGVNVTVKCVKNNGSGLMKLEKGKRMERRYRR
jgi:hypothetical protein